MYIFYYLRVPDNHYSNYYCNVLSDTYVHSYDINPHDHTDELLTLGTWSVASPNMVAALCACS